MTENWYYYDDDGLKRGVFSGGQIKYLAKAGIITPETLVETEGTEPIPAGRLKGLEFDKTSQRKSHRPRISLPALDELIRTAKPRTIIFIAMLGLVCIVISFSGTWWLVFWVWLMWGFIVAMFVGALTVMELAGNSVISLTKMLNWFQSDLK